MTFGDFVRAMMKEKGLSYERLGELVGKSSGGISNILAARPYPGAKYPDAVHKPTLEDMPKWAQALQLNEQQTQDLIELAELCHAPPALRARYLALRQGVAPAAPLSVPASPLRPAMAGDLAKARAANALLIEEVAELRARVASLEAELLAHRQEQAALADLLTKPPTDHAPWEPDTSGLPARRVADAPAETRTADGPTRTGAT